MRSVVIATLLLLAASVYAQTAPEYKLELGGGIGMVSYQGDFNGNIFKNPQPMFTALAKYRFDPRRALALNVSYGQLKGSSKDAKTYYPLPTTYDFNSKVVDAGLRLEYNFWPFGHNYIFRDCQRVFYSDLESHNERILIRNW